MNGEKKRKNTFLKIEKGILKNRREGSGHGQDSNKVQTSADYASQPSQSKRASPPPISSGRKSNAVSDVGSAKGKLSSKIRTKADAKQNLIAFMFLQRLSQSLS